MSISKSDQCLVIVLLILHLLLLELLSGEFARIHNHFWVASMRRLLHKHDRSTLLLVVLCCAGL